MTDRHGRLDDNVAKNLQSILLDRNISTSEFAKMVGVSYSQGTRLISGKSKIRKEALTRVCHQLKVDIRDVLGIPSSRAAVWLSVNEAADIARCHPATVYKAIASGSLMSEQRAPGGRHLIFESELELWAAGSGAIRRWRSEGRPTAVTTTADHVADLTAAITKVRELHVPIDRFQDRGDWECCVCFGERRPMPWPCPTVRAIEGAINE